MTTRTARNQRASARKTARKAESSMNNTLRVAGNALSKRAKGLTAWLEKGMPAVRARLETFSRFARDSATVIDKEIKGGWASMKKRRTARKEPAPVRKPAARKTAGKPAATARKKAAARRKVAARKAPTRSAAARRKAAPRRKAASAGK